MDLDQACDAYLAKMKQIFAPEDHLIALGHEQNMGLWFFLLSQKALCIIWFNT